MTSNAAHPYLARAVQLADWFVANQVTRTHLADRGRYANLVPFGATLGPDWHPIHFTNNWPTAMAAISLLMAHRRKRDHRYLDSAVLAGGYIKSLQVLDRRDRRIFGAFREETPQTQGCHPRDALSAAWGLLHLYQVTGDEDCLWRARTFAAWFSRHAMKDGYPAHTINFEKQAGDKWLMGVFHGGSPLFLFDLHRVTGEARWRRAGLAICDTWLRTFLREDGSLRVAVDEKTGRDAPPPAGDVGPSMHSLNDDFASLAMLRAYRLTGRRRYLEGVERFMAWVLRIQRADGAFGDPPVKSAAPMLIMELLDAYRLTRNPAYRQAAMRSVPYFLSLQELKSADPRYHGAFYDMDPRNNDQTVRQWLGVRSSAYALAALLRLESRRTYAGYTA